MLVQRCVNLILTDHNINTVDFFFQNQVFSFVKILIMYREFKKVNKRRNGENFYLLVSLAPVEFLISCPPFFVINVCSTSKKNKEHYGYS